ncbi:reverse transcriptase-like protein [Mycobacterium kansasii]
MIFITPQGDLLPCSFTLCTICTNNEAEYRALIIGMEIAHQMGIKLLHIFGDSKLIINQLTIEFEVRKQELLPYCRKA